MKILVVYWSQSGNTQSMADKVAEGASKAGASVNEVSVSDFDVSTIGEYDAYAFGCPASGAEQLEESEFQPFWDQVKSQLGSKKAGLFGSYGWGGGEWMQSWMADARENGVNLIEEGITANYAPDESVSKQLVELGRSLAK